MPAKFRPTPAITNVPASTPKELRPLLESLRAASLVRFGQGKNRMDRSITVRELVDLGLLVGDGTNMTVSNNLGTVVNPPSGGGTPGGPVETPDISGVQFSVNVIGVVITWSILSGLTDNAKNYTEIWRVGPVDPLADDSYPPMAIGTSPDGTPFVDWVNPESAVDDEGNLLPQPQIALSGTTPGYIYGESLELEKTYIYFLRFVGLAGDATNWHSVTGTRVDSVVDAQKYLDILEGKLTYAQLNSTLADEIDRIEYIDGKINLFGLDLEQNTVDLLAEIAAETEARKLEIREEVENRRTRTADIIDYIKAVDSAWDVKQEGRNQITDATIQTLQTTMNEGNAALAAQIESIVAASGNWYIQQEAPPINPDWNETYHWIDSDNQKRHYVSTDESRADASELWLATTDYTIDGTQTAAITFDSAATGVVDGEDYAVGLKIVSQTAGSVRIISGSNATPWWSTNASDAMYNGQLEADGTAVQIEASADFDGVISSVFLRPNALDFWASSPTLSSDWINNGGGSYTHEPDGTSTGTITATGLVTDNDEYRLTLNAFLPTVGAIGVRVGGVEVGSRQSNGGFHSWTFPATTGATIQIVGFNGFNGTVDNITIRRTSGWQGWIDVTDTRISSSIAAIVNESITRKDEDFALATEIATIFAAINNSETGLAALAQADSQTTAYINDEGEDGLFATSGRFDSLTVRVDNTETEIAANLEANQNLVTFLDDNGSEGYLATNLFSTEFKTQLYDDLSEKYTEQVAFDEFYQNLIDTSQDGFLAEQGWLIDLKQDITDDYEEYAASQTAFSEFQNKVYDTEEGVVAQNSAFQLLKTTFENKADEWDGDVESLQDFQTLVEDMGEDGFLAKASVITDIAANLNQFKDDTEEWQGGANGMDTFRAYVENTAANGFLATALDTSSIKTVLKDDVGLATNEALAGLRSDIKKSGDGSLLMQNSDFSQLDTNYNTLDDKVKANTKATTDLNNYIKDDGAGGLWAGSQRFTSLETAVTDETTGLAAQATNFENLETGIESLDGGILATSQYLNQQFASVGEDISAGISQVNNAIASESSARANAISNVEAYVGNVANGTGQVGAALQQSSEAIATLNGEISARYSNKLQVTEQDGTTRLTGFEFFDEAGEVAGSNSNFIIQTDYFSIRSASNPNVVPFYMDSNSLNLNFDVINLAGQIPSANIGTIDVGKITGDIGNFVTANIGDATITSAKLAGTIQSTNYGWNSSTATGTGWAINKSGQATFNDIYARGNIQATSIKADVINAVSTLMIQGNAVTVTTGAPGGSFSLQGSGWNTCCSVTVDWGSDSRSWPSAVIAHGTVNFGGTTGNAVYVNNRMTISAGAGGGWGGGAACTNREDHSASVSGMHIVGKPTERFQTFTLHALADKLGNANPRNNVNSSFIIIHGARR